MKTIQYRGWKIYKTAGGANNGLVQVNAKNPLRVGKLTAAVAPGRETAALAHLKRDIDALEAGNPT